MSINTIREQMNKNKAEIEQRKKRHNELQKKMAESVSSIVVKSGILECGISEKDLLKELKEIAARFPKVEEKKAS